MIRGKTTWKKDPTDAVKDLSRGMRNKAVRIALNAGAAPMKAAAVAQSPIETGALKKSFRIKVVNYKGKNIWVAVIGAKADFVKRKGKHGKEKKPGNYLALVDLGTKHLTGRHFMRAAYNSSINSALQTMKTKLRQQIEQLAASKS